MTFHRQRIQGETNTFGFLAFYLREGNMKIEMERFMNECKISSLRYTRGFLFHLCHHHVSLLFRISSLQDTKAARMQQMSSRPAYPQHFVICQHRRIACRVQEKRLKGFIVGNAALLVTEVFCQM